MAKYKIIPSLRTIVRSPISIGHKAEKGVEAIEFDLTAWVETYGSGTLTVIMRRWGDAIPYPIALEIGEDNKATWTLSDIDTAKAGMAYAQLNYIVGDEVVKKSDIYTFRVMDSLTGEGEPPEAYESWLEHLTHLAAEAMAEVLDIEGIVTDKTLTVDGGIADGKATGDALALKADKSTTYTKTEVDALIESVDVETDTTLSVSGKPADAKKTGDEISAIKADLGVAEIKKSFLTNEFEAGTIGYDGKNGTGQNFARTIGYIYVNKGDVFANSSDIVTPRVFIYGTGKVLDSVDPYTGWIGKESYIAPHDGFIRLVYKNVGSGAAIDNVSTIASSALIQRNATEENDDKNERISYVNQGIYTGIELEHKNLFNKADVVTGAIKTDGSFDSTYTDWRTTGYMLINPAKTYELYNFSRKTKRPSNVTVTVYDSKKIRLNTISVRDTTPNNVTQFKYLANYAIPTDAVYMRLSLQAVYLDALMVVVGTYTPLIYTPYNPQNYYGSNFKRGTNLLSFGKQGYNTLDKYTYMPCYPHSSKVSFIAALNEGFDGIWFAVLYTSDGYPVLCHNNDISDLAVNADGTALTEGYKISEHTYAEVSALDFGLPYGEMYEGTSVLTLEEGIKFAKHYGIKTGIEIESGETEARHTDICNLVKSYGMDKDISIFSYSVSILETVSELLPSATLYLYGGTTSAEAVMAATNLAPLLTDNNEVYLLFTPFTVDLTQEAITTIKGLGAKIAYTNPNSEPDTVVNFFEQTKNNYVSMCISRVIPTWKALRDNIIDNL